MNLGSTKTTAAALLAGLALLAAPAPAGAIISQKGKLRVAFTGNNSPTRLPRSQPAPVDVRMGGKISTTDRSAPPKLAQILLAINSHGKISTTGLPTCSLAKLEAVSAATAKEACAGALVGHGNVTSRVALPGQGAFASNGGLLAFNGTYKGRPAVLAQVESGPPLPLTYVIVFAVKKAKGTFGTELIGTLPPIASEYGYITAFALSLGRTYTSHGKKLSYASASCPAPQGFPSATFTFAEASYVFEGGTTLSAKVPGTCKVRG